MKNNAPIALKEMTPRGWLRSIITDYSNVQSGIAGRGLIFQFVSESSFRLPVSNSAFHLTIRFPLHCVLQALADRHNRPPLNPFLGFALHENLN